MSGIQCSIRHFELTVKLFFAPAPTTASIPSQTDLVMGLIRLNLVAAVPMTPIRLQRTRLRWDSQYVYMEGTVLDRAPPHSKQQHLHHHLLPAGLPLKHSLNSKIP